MRDVVWTPGRVRMVREAHGETQEVFAARIGVTLSTINRWENAGSKRLGRLASNALAAAATAAGFIITENGDVERPS